jgi:hypothetical protein
MVPMRTAARIRWRRAKAEKLEMTMRQAIVAEFRIWAEGATTVCTLSAILVLTFVVLVGCSPAPVPDDDRAPEGGMIEKVNSDDVDCRKQTRALAGGDPTAWHDRAYNDCMAGRGYKPGPGQTK